MDIEKLMKIMSDARKNGAGNLTIRGMLDKLNNFDDNEKVTLPDGKFFDGTADSYRGYYEDMYLGYCYEDLGHNTVGSLKQILTDALLTAEMTGYKGGEFPIEDDTLLWLASYGRCGDMIIDIQKINDAIIVITKEDD